MKRLVSAAIVALALVVPGAAQAAVTYQDGCDLLLTHPDATYADLYDGDGWITYDTDAGVIDLTAGGLGQLAPGAWTVVWEGGDTESVILDCALPVEDEPVDDTDDPCLWDMEAGEYVEGCLSDIGIASVRAVQVVAPPALPDTSTAPTTLAVTPVHANRTGPVP